MIDRELFSVAFGETWGRQMRFISGPRQAGKTTLALQKLKAEKCEQLYYLWDLRRTRNRYKDNELFFTADCQIGATGAWVCFDEIHKLPKWKNILKAVFDATGDRFRFIVTGSAKLNLLKRAGDSLAGRYFTFHLLPLTLREIAGAKLPALTVPETARAFIEERLSRPAGERGALEALLKFGGFPEPFLRQSRPFYRKWAADYLETVIREDIGSLTRIVEREYVYSLYQLLPEFTGSPISESSLAAHLQVSPVTLKNYLRRLEDFYLGFSVPPYFRNIKRALLKARKFYLFDWARMNDPAKRYETFVACQLRARLMLWSDASGESFDLYYVRNKQKQETDFLIVRQGSPWLLVETKLTDGPVEAHHQVTSQALGGIPIVQLCLEEGVAAQQTPVVYRLSAARLLN
jgi:predicted AAA+ superfamily ATPase